MNFQSQYENLHKLASEAVGGLSDFGPDDYQDGMRRLLADLDNYDVYNEMGRQSFMQHIIGLLVARLMLVQGLKDNPDASKTAIEKPIFIVGMPRTGTTVLHRILTQDPSMQWLPFWLSSVPLPRPPRAEWEQHPVFQQVKHGMEASPMFNKDGQAIHMIAPEQAEECRFVLDQTFWSSTLVLSANMPDYGRWFETTDSRYAYEYHKQVLSLVANGDQRRWVLKDPSHMSGIDALLAVYPDACIVQTHREPLDCMRSIANLSWHTRTLREPDLTQEVHGQSSLDIWSYALRKMERVRRASDEKRFFDIHINETRGDIIATMERIFDYFDLPISDEAHASWEKQLKIDPDPGYTKKHNPPDFGLSFEAVNKSIGDYYERYLQVCDSVGVEPRRS